MNLADFQRPDPIFIDANIFVYLALNTEKYQQACSRFLVRVEAGQVHGVTSLFVLNEVSYALLVGKAADILGTTKTRRIRERLAQDADLSARCYQVCREFCVYLDALRACGLRILSVDYDTHIASLALGRQYLLLPTDALHVATCQRYGVRHLATADMHLASVDALEVWLPDAS
jgi:predicted nucleic acid-binding protein